MAKAPAVDRDYAKAFLKALRAKIEFNAVTRTAVWKVDHPARISKAGEAVKSAQVKVLEETITLKRAVWMLHTGLYMTPSDILVGEGPLETWKQVKRTVFFNAHYSPDGKPVIREWIDYKGRPRKLVVRSAKWDKRDSPDGQDQ